MNFTLLIVGVVVGVALGAWVGFRLSSRRIAAGNADMVAVDFPQVLDLLRRAHDAVLACLVMGDEPATVSTVEPRPDAATVDRAVATARLAMGDSRQHVLHGDPEIIAVGDGQAGASVALPPDTPLERVEQVTADLRRLVAGARVRLVGGGLAHGDPRRAFDLALSRLDSVESLSVALCESAFRISQRSTAVVLRDSVTQVATVIAVSRGGDRKLIGVRVSADSSAGRASMGIVPVVGLSSAELLGIEPDERRRRGEAGVAYPLHDGSAGIGALVIFGRPEHVSTEVRESVAALAAQMSPHMAAAAAVRAAENRATTDQLTGLPNRRAFERAMIIAQGTTALLMVDVDHFKQINDGYGHAAGDAALKQLAQVFNRTLREGDLATRVGGEEFALLLRGADQRVALEVAERVRKATADNVLMWANTELRFTCSVGVAAYPAPIKDLANLMTAADAALFRAKQAGRNQVAAAAS